MLICCFSGGKISTTFRSRFDVFRYFLTLFFTKSDALMPDLSYFLLESVRLIALLAILFLVLRRTSKVFDTHLPGWNFLFSGLILFILGSTIALLNINPTLNPLFKLFSPLTWEILEKGLGYLIGSLCFGIGFYRLIPVLSDYRAASQLVHSVTQSKPDSNQTLSHAFSYFRENENRYKLLSNLANEGIAIHHDGIIIEANHAFCRHSGYHYKELIGMEIWRLFSEDCIKEMQQRVANKDTNAYESIFIRRDGSQWPAEIQGRHFSYQGKNARAATVRNISHEKLMEQKLNAIERHRQQIINNTPIILFALNSQGMIELVDGKDMTALNLSRDELIGQSMFDIFANNSTIIESTQQALNGKAVTYQATVKDRHYDVTLQPILDTHNKVSEVSGIAMDTTNRYLAEKAMRESDDKYRAIVDGIAQIGEGILIIDDDFRIHYMNSILIDWFGDQTGNVCFTSFGGKEASACEYCKLKEVTENKQNVLYQVQKPNGHIYDIVGAPIRLIDGRTAKLEVIRDVTEVEMAAEKLRMLSHAIEQSSSSLIVTDADSHIEYVNQKFCQNTGYTEEEVLGQKTNLFKSGYTNPKVYDELWDTITAGNDWQGELLNKRKNGELFWERTAISPFINPKNGVTRYLAIKEDITEQKKAEEILRLSATVFDTASEAVMITDKENRIQMVNKAFYRITGYREEEIIGKDPGLLSSGRHAPDFYETMWQILHEKGYWEGEIWNRRKNGEVFPEWLSITLVQDDNQHLSHYVSLFSDISKRKKDEERIIYQANYDALTGLPNRNLFKDRLSRAMQQSDREKQLVALLFIDLDRFKQINDSMGHVAGDKLLQSAAKRLSQSIRSTDTLARLGGDEFTVIMSGFEDVHAVEDSVNKLLSRLDIPYILNGVETFISASIGVAVYPDDGDDLDTLLINADNAMYRVKETGRNGYHFFTHEMNVEAHKRQELDTALHQALENDEFILHYQPIIDLSTDHPVSAEALVRWLIPNQGLVPPGQFIPLAEDTGLIVPIGEWVLFNACREAAAWQMDNGVSPGVSVNLSVRQFQRNDVTSLVTQALSETGLAPQLLTLEITESLLISDDQNVLKTLHELRDLGIELAIDDFGTGYSSLGYLKRFPITRLKIDRSFIMDVTNDPESAGLVEAILAMAKSLGLKVIAEGVETKAQVDFLKQRQCERVQGFYYSRPQPLEKLDWVDLNL